MIGSPGPGLRPVVWPTGFSPLLLSRLGISAAPNDPDSLATIADRTVSRQVAERPMGFPAGARSPLGGTRLQEPIHIRVLDLAVESCKIERRLAHIRLCPAIRERSCPTLLHAPASTGQGAGEGLAAATAQERNKKATRVITTVLLKCISAFSKS